MGGNKELKLSTIIFSTLVFAFFVLGMLAVLIYGFNSSNKLIQKAETIIPFPAAVINQTHWISVKEFYANTLSVRRFYENQDFSKLGIRVDFTTVDGQKRLKMKERDILTKMIEDRAIQILSEREGIKISSQDLADSVDKKLAEMGNGPSVKEQLLHLYGWSIEDFKQTVVKPSLYKEKLEAIFETKYQDSEGARAKIKAAESEISAKKKSFSDVVAEFSDGSSSRTAGELGWFKKGQIVPEIADQIFALRKGEQSAILESPLGFHLVEMEERKIDNGEELVRIRQIFVEKKTFADWVGEEMKKMKIWIPLKGYTWNKETMRVDFTSKELMDFEKQLLADPQGDISVMF